MTAGASGKRLFASHHGLFNRGERPFAVCKHKKRKLITQAKVKLIAHFMQ
jgi:hypothetical protein